eukprot:scaffold71014_cov32-Tisochrysis_lutea.AAC.2
MVEAGECSNPSTRASLSDITPFSAEGRCEVGQQGGGSSLSPSPRFSPVSPACMPTPLSPLSHPLPHKTRLLQPSFFVWFAPRNSLATTPSLLSNSPPSSSQRRARRAIFLPKWGGKSI